MEPSEAPETPIAPEAPEAPEEAAPRTPGPGARRRGRTTLLIGAAVALGLVAGVCAGYLIQADRPPTALPPLSQPHLPQARGPAPEPLPASRDRRVRTDGDLRELLLKKPRGARDAAFPAGEDGWLDLAGYAALYNNPGEAFGSLVEDEFRRAAVTGWREDGTYWVDIRLAQFRQEEDFGAESVADDAHYWAATGEDGADTESWPVPGTENAWAYVHGPLEVPGYRTVYSAEAHAWRGDIVMGIWIGGTKPISKAKIMDLAERQMERL